MQDKHCSCSEQRVALPHSEFLKQYDVIKDQIEKGVLNSRPLTYVYDEIDEILTPSHLVLGRRLMSQPDRSYV